METKGKTVKPMRGAIYPPRYRLRPDVVALIKTDNRLQGDLMKYLDISFNSLWRWLSNSDPRLTMYGVLYVIWNHIHENRLHLAEKYPKLTDLLETVKENVTNVE